MSPFITLVQHGSGTVPGMGFEGRGGWSLDRYRNRRGDQDMPMNWNGW